MQEHRCNHAGGLSPGIGDTGQAFRYWERRSRRHGKCQLTRNEAQLADRLREWQRRTRTLDGDPHQRGDRNQHESYERCALGLVLVAIGEHITSVQALLTRDSRAQTKAVPRQRQSTWYLGRPAEAPMEVGRAGASRESTTKRRG